MKKDKTEISAIVGYLDILLNMYEDDVVPTMIDDGNREERVEEITKLISYLKKTHSEMKYICKKCKNIEYWSAELFADKGEPVCPNDDSDMILIKER